MSIAGTDDIVRGRMAAGDTRENEVHRPGRVCQHESCSTVLSIYNASGWCWQHEQPHPYVLQAPRKRRRDAKAVDRR